MNFYNAIKVCYCWAALPQNIKNERRDVLNLQINMPTIAGAGNINEDVKEKHQFSLIYDYYYYMIIIPACVNWEIIRHIDILSRKNITKKS